MGSINLDRTFGFAELENGAGDAFLRSPYPRLT